MATDVVLDTTMVLSPSAERWATTNMFRVQSQLSFTTSMRQRSLLPPDTVHTFYPTNSMVLDLQELCDPSPKGLLQQCHRPPHHPGLHGPDRRSNWDGEGRKLYLRGEIRRRNQPLFEAYRCRCLEHGKQWTKYQWQPVLHHSCSDAVA